MDEVKLVELIYCEKERRGSGLNETDPIRVVRQLYEKDGTLLIEDDPAKIYTLKDVHLLVHDISNDLDKANKLELLTKYRTWENAQQ